MSNFKSIVLGVAFSLAIVAPALTISCSKEEKVSEVVAEATPLPEAVNKDVNVNVKVDQPPQNGNMESKKTEITNIMVDKPANSRINNDLANVNANLKKLQDQVNVANEQTKIELNKRIQQVNTDKEKLEQQVTELETKNRQAANTAQNNADIADNNAQMAKIKLEFVRLTQVKLDNFAKTLDTVKGKANSLEPDDQVNMLISKLEEQKTAIDQKMTVLDSSVDSTNFKSLRTQINFMMADLEKGYNRLVINRSYLR
jgi:DNA repair exonuclease SbcCD ATPase subunit